MSKFGFLSGIFCVRIFLKCQNEDFWQTLHISSRRNYLGQNDHFLARQTINFVKNNLLHISFQTNSWQTFWFEIWAKMTIFEQFWWPETNALEQFWAPRYRLKLGFWSTKIHLITNRIWRLKVDFGRAELPHYRKRRGSIFLTIFAQLS